MQVYQKELISVEVLCRERERERAREDLESLGYRVVADRSDRFAGTGAFADDLWYLKGERKVSEEGFAKLSDIRGAPAPPPTPEENR